jgi:glutathione S-transferase
MSGQTILYDLPTKQDTAWSVNPWKSKYNVDRTQADVDKDSTLDLELQGYRLQDGMGRVSRCRTQDEVIVSKETLDARETVLTPDRGLPPNPKDAPGYFTDYSIPAIKYEDGSYQMDSWLIAHELEKRYPSPSLHLDDPVNIKVRDQIPAILGPIFLQFLLIIPTLLPERSQEYFYRTREADLGKPLSEVHKEALANAEEGWKKTEESLKEVADLLKKHEGPYFLGKTVSYADFIFVSALYFVKCLSEEAYQRMLSLDPSISKVYEASKQWFMKDN